MAVTGTLNTRNPPSKLFRDRTEKKKKKKKANEIKFSFKVFLN